MIFLLSISNYPCSYTPILKDTNKSTDNNIIDKIRKVNTPGLLFGSLPASVSVKAI